jgi:PAS domain S-box-containing protein
MAISALKEKEAQIHRANRVLRTLTSANKAIVRADTEAELLENVCRGVVEEGGYRLAWIGYAENDREKTVRPMAQAGYEEGYLETLKITWADKKRGRGPTGLAIRTGQPALARNILTDPHFAPWRQEASKRGYASSLALPLLVDGVAFGALNIYGGEADAFDAAEVQLLADLAADVSFGIKALRGREERQRMAAALRRSYEELEARVQDRTQELAQSNAALQTEIAERLWSEKKLQASEEELQVVNEELQVQAEELLAANRNLNEAHAALQESRDDLNRAQAVAHTGSWRLDVRKNELLWSDETYRIFGIQPGTPLTYESFLAAVHLEDREYVNQQWTAALSGEPYDIEHRIVADGTVKWVRERAELEFDSRGQLLGGFGSVQDITGTKAAEEALQKSESRYRSLFQNNQAVMLLIDPATGDIVAANPAACFFYGYTHKELTRKKITDINLAAPEQVFGDMGRVKATEESHFFFKHRLAGGEVRDVEVYSCPLQVRGQTLLHSIIHDNTARKEAEETLRTSKDFLEIANRHSRMKPLLQDYAAAVKEHTGCEAVAIRILDEQGSIPYEAYEGFPPEFIACESLLSIDSDQCLCSNVCKGVTDRDLPCYTPGSSCYINRYSHLLATTPPGLLGETRNICHQFGYESVALVPIVFGGRILGLIHLADHRENVVPLSLVTRLERIALTLGTAINRVRAEEARRWALADSQQRQTEIGALLQATRAVLDTRTFPEICRSIYDSCKDLIGASSGYIALLTADGQENEVLFLDTGGLDCQVDPSLPMAVRGLRGEAYRHSRTVYHNDFSASEYTEFLPPGHVVLDNVLFAPLVVRGETVGLLGLGNKPGGYTQNDARLAAGFGELAAMALSNQRADAERERLIRELETERARLQAIIASAPEAIVVADADGSILMTNPAADRLYAHPDGCVQDAPSCALFQFCRADGGACVPGDQPLLRSATAGETHRNLEMVLSWPDGQNRDLLVNTAPIKDHQGRSSGAVGLFQDITQRKRVEDKIRKLNAELSDRIREVSERTLQLEAANKELEAFSYSVSHDLRSPLRAIEGFARILMEDRGEKLDGESLRLLNVIRSNTRIMGDLIDDLLAFSRLGRQEVRAQKIDMGGLVTSIFGELGAQDPERQMQLILNPLPAAFGDRNLINQVLVNLLGNAVKFTKSREKAIIEVGGWTEGKEDIYFVKDNGVGFDMRYVDKVFGVFQRLHRREEFEGTGVGLAIVQRIINRHGGRVWATGKVNSGAAFYFALPRQGEKSVT